jgi:predicted P-loop ATPase
MNKPLDKPFLTTKEAAEYLDIRINTLDVYRNRNTGPKCEFDINTMRYLYSIDDLDEWNKNRLSGKKNLTDNSSNTALGIINNLLAHDYSFQFNEFDQNFYVKHPGEKCHIKLTDNLTASLMINYERKTGQAPKSKQLLEMAIIGLAEENKINPLVSWLKDLTWDGEDRLDTWISKYFKVPQEEYLKETGNLLLIAAVNRALNPGCDYQIMVIFEGPQGSRKTGMIKALAYNDDWYGNELAFEKGSAEIITQLAGKWIIEAEEITSLLKVDPSNIKRFISRSSDQARVSYGRFRTDAKRRCVFIGTTNMTQYLKDASGARRFIPIRLTKLLSLKDLNDFKEIVPQLWAEAYAKRNWWGKELILTDNTQKYVEGLNALRLYDNPWKDKIALMLPVECDGYTTRNEIFNKLLIPIRDQDLKNSIRIDEAMLKLGFEKGSIELNGGDSLAAYSKNNNYKDELILTSEYEK